MSLSAALRSGPFSEEIISLIVMPERLGLLFWGGEARPAEWDGAAECAGVGA